MGNQLGVGAGGTGGGVLDLPSLLLDVPSFTLRVDLGGGKFLKSMHCLYQQQNVLVKIYVRRDDTSLEPYERRLQSLRTQILADPKNFPGVATFEMFELSPKAAFMVRQFFAFNLYDRFHTRPFLMPSEKAWFSYCLLRTLTNLHKRNICHGDIKTENLLCTTWSWLYLSDFASCYKPTMLPEDNPADFHYYFDAGQRRRCYIAPERFYSSRSQVTQDLVPSMDIFSVGCVIAEIFLEGDALFDLPQLLKYKESKYDPTVVVNKISDPGVRQMVMHMIQLSPTNRLTAGAYIESFTGSVFPVFFDRLYNFMRTINQPECAHPDAKIKLLRDSFPFLMGCVHDPDVVTTPSSHHTERKRPSLKLRTTTSSTSYRSQEDSKAPSSRGQLRAYASLLFTRIEQLVSDSQSLHNELLGLSPPPETQKQLRGSTPSPSLSPGLKSSDSSAIDMMSSPRMEKVDYSNVMSSEESKVLLPLVSLVSSSIRSVSSASNKLVAISLLESLGRCVEDDVRIGRVVPYLMASVGDASAAVRAASIVSLSNILGLVKTLAKSDAYIFPEYIFPSLSMIPSDPSIFVRLTYAQYLPRLAETSRRFLELSCIAYVFRPSQARRMLTSHTTAHPSATNKQVDQNSFDRDLQSLHKIIFRIVGDILNGRDSKVKVALLNDIGRLGMVFGRDRTNSWLLPMLITVLNDQDHELRASFFINIVGIGMFVGRESLQNFILPCIEQAITDVEESVVMYAIQALTSFCEMGLFQHHILLDVVERVAPLLCHPSLWLRGQTIHFLCSISNQLGSAKTCTMLVPRFRLFLGGEMFSVNYESLMATLKPPVTRAMYDRAIQGKSLENHIDLSKEEKHTLKTMGNYIDSVAAAIRQKRQNMPNDNQKDDTKYRYLFSHCQLYGVRVSPSGEKLNSTQKRWSATVPSHSNAAVALSQVGLMRPSQVKDASHDVTKVEYYRNVMDLHNPFRPSPVFVDSENLSSLVRVILEDHSEKPGSQKEEETANPHQGPSRILVERSALSASTVEALQLPPEKIDLGEVVEDTVSTSLFFKNGRPGWRPYMPEIANHTGWRPKGILVAELGEHSGPVRQISVARDNLFIASASDDGTVKIWDAARLEKAVYMSSQLTYSGHKSRVISVCVCDGSHGVASGSSRGDVHVFRVEYASRKDGAVDKYVGVTSIAKRWSAREGAIMAVENFNQLTQSLVTFASQAGRIHGWDLRAKREAFLLTLPGFMAIPTCLGVGPSEYALSVGTSHGYVSTFDLRFHVPVCQWQHSSHMPISNITPTSSTSFIHRNRPELVHPENGPLIIVAAAGSHQVSAFDMYSGECREIFQPVPISPTHIDVTGAADAAGSTPLPQMKSCIGTQRALGVHVHSDIELLIAQYIKNRHLSSPLSSASSTHGDISEPPFISGVLCSPRSFMMTAGSDRIIRYWNMRNPRQSYRISPRSMPETGSAVYDARLKDEVSIYEEYVRTTQSTELLESRSLRRGPVQADTAHDDVILDLKALEFPHPMLLSSCRNGKIKAWV